MRKGGRETVCVRVWVRESVCNHLAPAAKHTWFRIE